MTIQIEIECKPRNLRNTAEYFSTTEGGSWPVGFEEQPTLIEDYETFLLDMTETMLKTQTTLQMLRERCSRPIVIYKSVWVYITLRENTAYVAGDLVTTVASSVVIRDLDSLSRRDNGLIRSRTFNLSIAETGALLAHVTFLTVL